MTKETMYQASSIHQRIIDLTCAKSYVEDLKYVENITTGFSSSLKYNIDFKEFANNVRSLFEDAHADMKGGVLKLIDIEIAKLEKQLKKL